MLVHAGHRGYEWRMTAADIDTLVAKAILHRPDLSGKPVRVFQTGFDSVALGIDGWLFKFPRNDQATVSLRREAALLEVIRPRVSMPVPEMRLFDSPEPWSMHRMIPGGHLTPQIYDTLHDRVRAGLADDLALFHAQMHAIDAGKLRQAGAGPVGGQNLDPANLALALAVLKPVWHATARRIMSGYRALPPDPLGRTFGFFDGHGWNMAFDRRRQRLNGIYDFADSGFGPVHLDFVFSDFISRDLTSRILLAYSRLTGLDLDRHRVDLLMGALILDEVAGAADYPDRRDEILSHAERWLNGFEADHT